MFKQVFFFILFFVPGFSLANINFSEIMFDPEGADTDREWIEIRNTAGFHKNLEGYKFCDSGSCHTLFDEGDNDFKIPGNAFGVIAKKPEKFRVDYPDFEGFILRSSFSLRNSPGELLELKDDNGNIISVIEYKPEVGGKDGNTFSLFDDTWKNSQPTPGAVNIFSELIPEEESLEVSGGEEGQSIQRTYVAITESDDMVDGKKKLRAEIVNNIPTLIAGAENEFNARAYGITGVEINNVEYFWNFGDGKKKREKNALHTFAFPGEYIITLVVKSANFTGNIRRTVLVVEPRMKITEVDVDKNWIKVKNNYTDILKLDNWLLMVDGEKFKIPRETYILSEGEIIFPNSSTHLDVRPDSNIFLLFPNGEKVTKFVDQTESVITTPVVKKEYTAPKKVIKKTTQKRIVEQDIVHNTVSNEKKEQAVDKKYIRRNIFHVFDEKDFEEERIFHLHTSRSFFREHMYFLLFIGFMGSLVVISFILHARSNMQKKTEDMHTLAKEFEIEEL